MQLSIIVLTCNQPAVTARLFKALHHSVTKRMMSDKAWEVILIDNGSQDAENPEIRKFADCWGDCFTLISSPENVGVAAGRNLGLLKAKGDYLLILDNDTIPDDETVCGLINHLESHPDCGLCAPALLSPEGVLQNSAKPFPGISQKMRHLLSGKLSKSEIEAMNSPHPFYMIGACQMISRRAFGKTGLLDNNIFFGPEDADYCIRLRNNGFSVDYLPHLSLMHDWQRSSRRSPFSRQSRLHIKALLYFYIKYKRFL